MFIPILSKLSRICTGTSSFIPSVYRMSTVSSAFLPNIKESVPWRDAATLILAAPNGPGQPLTYLTMERSKDSSFMGSSICFPGGALSAADSSPEWTQIFRRFGGVNVNKLKFLTEGARRPQIYSEASEIDDLLGELPREISMRIAAIRETFEECGILLSTPPKASSGGQSLTEEDMKAWQKRVSDDPKEFIRLFESVSLAPDIEALFEWSNWLTPPFENKRFDALFFLAMLPAPRPPLIDTYEVANARWVNAKQLLEEFAKGQIWLPTPQMYEMIGLKEVKRLEELNELAILRKKWGIERWCPQAYYCAEGVLLLLPGDDMYPKEGERDIYKRVKSMSTLEGTTFDDLRAKSEKHHRIEYYMNEDTKRFRLVRNIPVRFGQLYPTHSNSSEVKSHL